MQQIRCPHCGYVVIDDGQFAGQVVACPQCHGRFQMPGQLLRAAPAFPHVSPESSTSSGNTYRRRRQRDPTIAIVFGLLALVVLAGGAYSVFNNTQQGTAGSLSTAGSDSAVETTVTESKRSGPSIVESIKGAFTKPGRVRVTVTWEYNKFVGNKPDTDATVTLVPIGYSRKVDASLDPIFARISFDTTRRELREQGVYAGIVGGDGKTLIADVPAGSYTMVIISKNTNENPKIAEFEERTLARYFKNGGSAAIHKIHITDITVSSGEETEYSHDFGNTYF